MREVSAKSLIGMPVYSITEGESIGVVRNVILDPEAKQLLAFAVDRRGWYRDVKIIAYSKVKNIGTDAITIEERNSAQRAANLPKMVQYMHQPSHLVGNRVISDNGHTLGRVDEYYLDSETGTVCRLDVSGGVMGNIISGKAIVKGKYIITIGVSAIVVDRHCLNDIETVESSLKLNLQEAKEKAGQAWQSTVNGSKKLGKSVSAKLTDMKESYEENKRAKTATEEAAATDETENGAQDRTGKKYRFSLRELLNKEKENEAPPTEAFAANREDKEQAIDVEAAAVEEQPKPLTEELFETTEEQPQPMAIEEEPGEMQAGEMPKCEAREEAEESAPVTGEELPASKNDGDIQKSPKEEEKVEK